MKTISITSLDYKTLESEKIMGKLGIRNIYELVVYQTVNVIFKVKMLPCQKHFGQNFK